MMTDKSAAGCVILLKFGMLVYYGPRNKSQNEWRDVQQSQAAMHPNARPSEHRKFFSAELFYTGPSLFQTAQPPPITFTLYAMGSLVGRTNRHLPNSFHNFYREWVKKLAKWSRYSTTLASEPPSFRIWNARTMALRLDDIPMFCTNFVKFGTRPSEVVWVGILLPLKQMKGKLNHQLSRKFPNCLEIWQVSA